MATDSDTPDAYSVIARRRRPQDFAALVGQDAMVRVLTNAFERGRLPHAIMLTGVRGVGKTTTARIIAKGLNCESSDGPTVQPCGTCKSCVEIAESRHTDVLEMDAASRTGIDDIREIIESVRYRASQGRYKVYIIDEVHMLSKNAFNGLLKTLEEPPEHVTFILATTDIHKVPVTVLSRCMRFDLRRVPAELMIPHLSEVAAGEGASLEPDALALIARLSEGSVRDSLSLLDQAIAHAGGGAAIAAADLREMLGLAERGRVIALFEQVMTGDPAGALETLAALYRDGADPNAVMRDLAEVCHLATLARAAPARLDDPAIAPSDREEARRLAEALSMRALARAWQMLLKAIDEVGRAPSAIAAAEMALIRMSHVADLPSPDETIRRLSNGAGAATGASARGAPDNGGGRPSATDRAEPGRAMGGADAPLSGETPPRGAATAERAGAAGGPGGARLTAIAGGQAAAARRPLPEPETVAPPARAPASEPADASSGPTTFEEIAALVREQRDGKLMVEVESFVRPGPVSPGRFEFTPTAGAPESLAARLADRLTAWTGRRWVVSVADGHSTPTIMESRASEEEGLRATALSHPLIQAALAAFPGAELVKVADLSAAAAEAAAQEQLAPPPEEDDLLDDGFEPLIWTPDGLDPETDLDGEA